MKTRYYLLSIISVLLAGMTALFVACDKDLNDIVKYTGKVVYINTTNPFPDLEVRLTDGSNVYCVEHTDTEGCFTLTVKVAEISGDYYILVGDSTCVPKKVELPGYGQPEINLGTIEVEGPTLPVVSTKAVTNITDSKATSGGKITADGRSSVTARGVCWAKTEYPIIDDSHTTNGKGVGEFTSQLTGLEPGNTYYVRAYATNRLGTAYGEQKTFTALTGLPVVTTAPVSDIRKSTALGGGNVESNGGYRITARGICWSSTSSFPNTDDNHTNEVADNGSFTSLMIGLEANTTYYVRAYATNEIGTSYGTSVSFKTANGLPSVVTTPIGENISDSTIISGGQVTDEGDFPVIAYGVVYGTVPYPTIEKNEYTNDGSGIGYYGSSITINASTNTYYIRAYATNEKGTSYGEQEIVTPEKYDYCNLKTMERGGYTYRIKSLGVMSWTDGNTNCGNMVYGGYDDWFMPNDGEVQDIIIRYGKGGCRICCQGIDGNEHIWTSTKCNDNHYSFHVITTGYGSDWCDKWNRSSSAIDESLYLVFAVRKYRTDK